MNVNAVLGDDYIIRGCRLLGGTPVDIRVQSGVIVAIDSASEQITSYGPSIDARGLIMLPGLVDLHTHLREPGGEDAESIASGSRAAAAGGYTDVFAMANTNPVTDSLERLATVLVAAAAQNSCRVHPIGAITIGLGGAEIAPLSKLAEAGVRMFSDDGKCVDDAKIMLDALTLAAEHGFLVAQHAQHRELCGAGQINAGPVATSTGLAPWPGIGEEAIIARDILLAAETGGALHVCHVSTARSVELVRFAKAQGWLVSAEVTPHHLLLTDDLASLGNARYKVNPPLRSTHDVTALRRGLLDGTIDIVATDHAPHTANRKLGDWCDAAFGMTGLETALAVIVHVLAQSGKVDWALVARVMAESPARLGRIDDRAGRPIAVGESATFCLLDEEREWEVTKTAHVSKSANNPFIGCVFRTAVIATAIDGRLTFASADIAIDQR
jgi:dihydroorotase